MHNVADTRVASIFKVEGQKKVEGPIGSDIFFSYNMLLRACKVHQSLTYYAIADFRLNGVP